MSANRQSTIRRYGQVCGICNKPLPIGTVVTWCPNAPEGKRWRCLEGHGEPEGQSAEAQPVNAGFSPSPAVENGNGEVQIISHGTALHTQVPPADNAFSFQQALMNSSHQIDPTPKVAAQPIQTPVVPAVPVSPVAQNGSGIDALGVLASALVPHLAQQIAGKVDESRVTDLIDSRVPDLIESAINQAIQGLRPVVQIEVKHWDGQTVKMSGLNHKNTEKLLRWMTCRDAQGKRKNIYLWGPAGSFKSTTARKCAEALGLRYMYTSLNPQSSATRIEGYTTPHGEYVMTLFRDAYEHGGVFCADEMDNSSPNIWISINNAIDSDLGSFPDGMVKRHPDFIFVGTGNTNLAGDRVYRDRRPLDKATIRRFVFIYWDYDEPMEEQIVLANNPKAQPWFQFVVKARQWAKVNNPDLYAYLTPSASFDGACGLRDGFKASEVLEDVVLKGAFDDTAKRAMLTAAPLPTANMEVIQ